MLDEELEEDEEDKIITNKKKNLRQKDLFNRKKEEAIRL